MYSQTVKYREKKKDKQVASGKCSAKAIRGERTEGMGDMDETQEWQSITWREGEVISKAGP